MQRPRARTGRSPRLRDGAAAPTLTALRRAGPGRVALEVDGERWRVVPDEVVVRAGLRAGRVLDRPLLRDVGRALRRSEALGRAGRVLARRELSEAALRTRLRSSGVAPAAVEETAETLRRAGALDDVRFACARARGLADRGWGDEAIAFRLDGEGARAEAVREALAGLAPEHERAAHLAAGLAPRKAAALLQRRGFDPDTIEATVPALDAGP